MRSRSTAVTAKQLPMSRQQRVSNIKSEDVQDLVITAVENRFGLINTLPKPIEWLTDNGSCFIAKDTRSLLIDIALEPCSRPNGSSQFNGMAEVFVKALKRD